MLKYKVSLNDIGLKSADLAYGGYINAYSFYETNLENWLYNFRMIVLSKMGKEYLPIYRMADGEYRFLMGRKLNLHKRPLIREIIAVTAESLRLKNPNKWKTSWGEEYSPKKVSNLREKLIQDVNKISKKGFLACFYNENGLHAFEEYNNHLQPFFSKYNIKFDIDNYIPFHFVCGLLVKDGGKEFFENRNILVVTGSDDDSELKIKESMSLLNVNKIGFIRISKTSSMEEILNFDQFINEKIDLILVAAGIGSANIITQLEPLNTVTLDIGGFINCFKDRSASQHGGIFKLPI